MISGILSARIPGPIPTPVLSPEVIFACSLDRIVGDWAGGETGAGGGAMISRVRREAVGVIRRGLWGEGGRELISGDMFP